MHAQLIFAAENFGRATQRPLVNFVVHESLPKDKRTLHLALARVNPEHRECCGYAAAGLSTASTGRSSARHCSVKAMTPIAISADHAIA